MTIKKFNYPYELELIKANSWKQYEENKYFMLRLHLHIQEYQSESTSYPGEIIGTFHTTEKLEIVNAIEKEHSVTNIDETICSHIISEDIMSQIESEISTGISSPTYNLSAKTKANIQEKISSSISFTSKESTSVTYSSKERFEVTQTIVNRGNEKYHAVTCYKPMRCDIYLHYIDYLIAEYSTSMFGLRKKKKNFPRPETENHPNRQNISQPLFSLTYWQLLPKSSNIYSDKDYQSLKDKVLLPEKITIEKMIKPINLYLPEKPERPTLYTLSNIAFPYLWINREGPWTVEDLKKIELDEAEGSAWWFRHKTSSNF